MHAYVSFNLKKNVCVRSFKAGGGGRGGARPPKEQHLKTRLYRSFKNTWKVHILEIVNSTGTVVDV